MNLRRILAPVLGVAALAGAGAAAFATRDAWVPVVFPADKPKAGGHEHGHDDDDDGHHFADHEHAHADRVKLSPQARQNLKLEVGQLTPQPYSRTLLIPGVVVDRPGDSDRSVPARLSGIVTRIDARPGDVVTAGQSLFTLEPTGELVRGQAELATAVKELAILTANRDTVAAQVRDKTRPANDLVEPQKQVDLAANRVDGLRKQLRALKLTGPQIDRAAAGEFVTEITVPAPTGDDADPAAVAAGGAAGGASAVYEVEELKVTLGDTVQAGQTLGVLAAHQRLYVEGRAFESELPAVAALAEQQAGVKAEFADEPPGGWPSQPPLVVHHLSNTIDPSSRTFAFYLSLDNRPRPFDRDGKPHLVWRYRPGQRVRLRVPVEKLADDALVLPAGAVVREGADAFAFVQNGELFVRKAVRVLYEGRGEVVLANDGSLPGGASVVKNQAAALNRALKAAVSEGEGGHEHHDHEH